MCLQAPWCTTPLPERRKSCCFWPFDVLKSYKTFVLYFCWMMGKNTHIRSAEHCPSTHTSTMSFHSSGPPATKPHLIDALFFLRTHQALLFSVIQNRPSVSSHRISLCTLLEMVASPLSHGSVLHTELGHMVRRVTRTNWRSLLLNTVNKTWTILKTQETTVLCVISGFVLSLMRLMIMWLLACLQINLSQ